MTESHRLRKYVVGDEITASMKLWHRMNLLSVEVVFEHGEDPSITLILSNHSDSTEYSSSAETLNEEGTPSEPQKISTMLLSGEVELGHIPGEYAASRVEFYTAAGQEIQYDLRADKSIPARVLVKDRNFRVVPESNSIDGATLELINEGMGKPTSEC